MEPEARVPLPVTLPVAALPEVETVIPVEAYAYSGCVTLNPLEDDEVDGRYAMVGAVYDWLTHPPPTAFAPVEVQSPA